MDCDVSGFCATAVVVPAAVATIAGEIVYFCLLFVLLLFLLLLLFVFVFVLVLVLLVVLLFLMDAPPGGPPGGGSTMVGSFTRIGASRCC